MRRTLTKNHSKVWYANFIGNTEEVDVYGNHTGRYYPTYTTPTQKWMNIGWTIYPSRWDLNGITTDYRREIVTCDRTLGWKEDTVLWIGIDPTDDQGQAVKPNYIVDKVSDTINAIRYRIREVETQ